MAQQVTDGFNKTSIYSLTGSPSHGWGMTYLRVVQNRNWHLPRGRLKSHGKRCESCAMRCFPASYSVVGRIVSNKASFRAHTKVVYQTALGDALLSLAFTFTVHVQGFLGWAKNSWWNTLQWGNPGRLYLLKLSSGSYWWSLSQSWKQLRCSTGSSKWPCWQMSVENGS